VNLDNLMWFLTGMAMGSGVAAYAYMVWRLMRRLRNE